MKFSIKIQEIPWWHILSFSTTTFSQWKGECLSSCDIVICKGKIILEKASLSAQFLFVRRKLNLSSNFLFQAANCFRQRLYFNLQHLPFQVSFINIWHRHIDVRWSLWSKKKDKTSIRNATKNEKQYWNKDHKIYSSFLDHSVILQHWPTNTFIVFYSIYI